MSLCRIQKEDRSHIDFNVFYADNSPAFLTLDLNLLARDWYKIASQPCFLATLEYLADQQIPGSRETLAAMKDLTGKLEF